MDKYEYKQKTDQMLELMREGSFRKAAEIADEIDWRRVRNASMLETVGDIYEKTLQYNKSYRVFTLAYRRAEGSRKLLGKLSELALKTGRLDRAIDYYEDFIKASPKDPNRYILRYQILRAQKAPLEQQIEALETYKKSEYVEEWAYELAKLYHEAGRTEECLDECDDLILWFSEGQYVYKAMELKMQYKPLTPSQQERYDRRFAGPDSETAEMPDISAQEDAKDDAPEDTVKAVEVQEEALQDQTEEITEAAEAENTEAGDTENGNTEAGNTEAENTEAAADTAENAAEDTEEPVEEKKKKIGDTMPLDEALRMLLHLEPEQPEVRPEPSESEKKETDLSDLERAVGEIEAVADADMVRQITEERAKKRVQASSRGKMTEIIPDDDIDIDEPETEEPAIEEEEILDIEDAGDFLLDAEDAEDFFDETDVTEEIILPQEGETEGDSMADQKTKNIDPILPDDIQRMIDEIEGVIPEEEVKPAPAPKAKVEEVHENMGKVADSLRIDDDDDFEEFDFDEDEADEFLDEDGEEYEEEDEYLDEDGEEYEEEDEYLDEGGEEYEEEDEYLDEDGEEYEEEDEYLDEDGEEYEEEDEYLDEDGEEYEEEDEYLDEDGEEYEEEDEYFDEDEDDGEFEEADEYLDEEEDEGEFEEVDEYLDEDEDEGEFEEVDGYIDEEEYEEEDEYLDEDEEEYEEEDEEFEESDEEIADWDADLFSEEDVVDGIDDREIPDDDDNMDILSATTPLSRKETAKMIATGKTAPLPLDEISDAMSLSDTGFIVHGRYDLGIQSGIGTRAGLTEEQKKLFSYFVPVRGMSEQLVDVLEQDKNCTNRQGTSRTGNLLIVGNKGNGKTVLAVDVVKAIQKQRNIHQGKVAIVTGDSLNKKKISDIFDKLYGGALIIEKAGKMNEKTVARLNKAMEKDTGELLIVLEEQRKPIDRLLSSNREFRRKFTSRLEVPIFINDELVTFGQTYAQENGYRIDEMGILALYSKIDSLQREDHAVTVAEVKEIMDEAIQHSQKASAKKLVKRVFGKNTDEADRILLSEKDFNI